ncbi:MAG: DUF4869 domain-containing protein [Firmicutes bacterium]|nr:DUF4869 domain-containing protein [Bacillota bacterium]
MLKIYFGEMDGVLHNVETYFKNQMDYSWLEDEQVRRIIEDVDQSVVESPQCISSRVLGQIPPTRLSGGTKALILILNLEDRVVNASNCGDNCAKWLLEFGKQKDITINLNHIMDFGAGNFEIEILNDHCIVHNMREYVLEAVKYL